jgi:hypothetical protein
VQTTYWTTVKYKAGERIQIIHAPSADPLWESSSTAKYVGECTPIIHAPTADPLRESSSTVKYEAGERTRIIHAHVHVVRFPMPLSTKYIPEQAFVEGMEGGGEVDEQKIRNQAPSTSTLQTNTTGGLDEPVTTNVAREASLVVWKGSTCAVGRK